MSVPYGEPPEAEKPLSLEALDAQLGGIDNRWFADGFLSSSLTCPATQSVSTSAPFFLPVSEMSNSLVASFDRGNGRIVSDKTADAGCRGQCR
jgi:hypothetical protein